MGSGVSKNKLVVLGRPKKLMPRTTGRSTPNTILSEDGENDRRHIMQDSQGISSTNFHEQAENGGLSELESKSFWEKFEDMSVADEDSTKGFDGSKNILLLTGLSSKNHEDDAISNTDYNTFGSELDHDDVMVDKNDRYKSPDKEQLSIPNIEESFDEPHLVTMEQTGQKDRPVPAMLTDLMDDDPESDGSAEGEHDNEIGVRFKKERKKRPSAQCIAPVYSELFKIPDSMLEPLAEKFETGATSSSLIRKARQRLQQRQNLYNIMHESASSKGQRTDESREQQKISISRKLYEGTLQTTSQSTDRTSYWKMGVGAEPKYNECFNVLRRDSTREFRKTNKSELPEDMDEMAIADLEDELPYTNFKDMPALVSKIATAKTNLIKKREQLHSKPNKRLFVPPKSSVCDVRSCHEYSSDSSRKSRGSAKRSNNSGESSSETKKSGSRPSCSSQRSNKSLHHMKCSKHKKDEQKTNTHNQPHVPKRMSRPNSVHDQPKRRGSNASMKKRTLKLVAKQLSRDSSLASLEQLSDSPGDETDSRPVCKTSKTRKSASSKNRRRRARKKQIHTEDDSNIHSEEGSIDSTELESETGTSTVNDPPYPKRRQSTASETSRSQWRGKGQRKRGNKEIKGQPCKVSNSDELVHRVNAEAADDMAEKGCEDEIYGTNFSKGGLSNEREGAEQIVSPGAGEMRSNKRPPNRAQNTHVSHDLQVVNNQKKRSPNCSGDDQSVGDISLTHSSATSVGQSGRQSAGERKLACVSANNSTAINATSSVDEHSDEESSTKGETVTEILVHTPCQEVAQSFMPDDVQTCCNNSAIVSQSPLPNNFIRVELVPKLQNQKKNKLSNSCPVIPQTSTSAWWKAHERTRKGAVTLKPLAHDKGGILMRRNKTNAVPKKLENSPYCIIQQCKSQPGQTGNTRTSSHWSSVDARKSFASLKSAPMCAVRKGSRSNAFHSSQSSQCSSNITDLSSSRKLKSMTNHIKPPLQKGNKSTQIVSDKHWSKSRSTRKTNNKYLQECKKQTNLSRPSMIRNSFPVQQKQSSSKLITITSCQAERRSLQYLCDGDARHSPPRFLRIKNRKKHNKHRKPKSGKKVALKVPGIAKSKAQKLPPITPPDRVSKPSSNTKSKIPIPDKVTRGANYIPLYQKAKLPLSFSPAEYNFTPPPSREPSGSPDNSDSHRVSFSSSVGMAAIHEENVECPVGHTSPILADIDATTTVIEEDVCSPKGNGCSGKSKGDQQMVSLCITSEGDIFPDIVKSTRHSSEKPFPVGNETESSHASGEAFADDVKGNSHPSQETFPEDSDVESSKVSGHVFPHEGNDDPYSSEETFPEENYLESSQASEHVFPNEVNGNPHSSEETFPEESNLESSQAPVVFPDKEKNRRHPSKESLPVGNLESSMEPSYLELPNDAVSREGSSNVSVNTSATTDNGVVTNSVVYETSSHSDGGQTVDDQNTFTHIFITSEEDVSPDEINICIPDLHMDTNIPKNGEEELEITDKLPEWSVADEVEMVARVNEANKANLSDVARPDKLEMDLKNSCPKKGDSEFIQWVTSNQEIVLMNVEDIGANGGCSNSEVESHDVNVPLRKASEITDVGSARSAGEKYNTSKCSLQTSNSRRGEANLNCSCADGIVYDDQDLPSGDSFESQGHNFPFSERTTIKCLNDLDEQESPVSEENSRTQLINTCFLSSGSTMAKPVKSSTCQESNNLGFIKTILDIESTERDSHANWERKLDEHGRQALEDQKKLDLAMSLSCDLLNPSVLFSLSTGYIHQLCLKRVLPDGLDVVTFIQTMTNLQELDVSNNYIGPHAFRTIVSGMTRNNTITTFNIAHNDGTPECAECLGELVRKNTVLRTLDVSSNNLGRTDFSRHVGLALKTNSTLKTLRFSNCGVTDIREMVGPLVLNSSLKNVTMSNNVISGANHFGVSLASWIQSKFSVMYLDIENCALGVKGFQSVTDAMRMNGRLRVFNLSGSEVATYDKLGYFFIQCVKQVNMVQLVMNNMRLQVQGRENLIAKMKEVHTVSQLSSLSLDNCQLRDVFAKNLERRLSATLLHLKELSLANNLLTVATLRSFQIMMSGYINQSCSLEKLNFSKNNAEDIDQFICEDACPQMKYVNLSFARISYTTLGKLLPSSISERSSPQGQCSSYVYTLILVGIDMTEGDVIEESFGKLKTSCTQLSHLDMSECNLGNTDVKYISKAMQFNLVPLLTLKLAKNYISDDGVSHLVYALLGSSVLQRLNLHGNKIQDRGAQILSCLFDRWDDNKSRMQSIDVSSNHIGPKGVVCLLKSLAPGNNLYGLDVSRQKRRVFTEDDMMAIFKKLASVLGFGKQTYESLLVRGSCEIPPHIPQKLHVNVSQYQLTIEGNPNVIFNGGFLGQVLDSEAIVTGFSKYQPFHITLDQSLQLALALGLPGTTDNKFMTDSLHWKHFLDLGSEESPKWLTDIKNREGLRRLLYVTNITDAVTFQRLRGVLKRSGGVIEHFHMVRCYQSHGCRGIAWIMLAKENQVERALEMCRDGRACIGDNHLTFSQVSLQFVRDLQQKLRPRRTCLEMSKESCEIVKEMKQMRRINPDIPSKHVLALDRVFKPPAKW